MNFFIALLISMQSLLLFGAEVDQYTMRDVPLSNSLQKMNALANIHLKLAVDEANINNSCDTTKKQQMKLYKELRRHFANHTKGRFIKAVLNSKKIETHFTPLKESIYKDWKLNNGLIIKLTKNSKSPFALFPLINVNNYTIGLDKFEHMFGMGFKYFNKFYFNKSPIKDVLEFGATREIIFLGGVFLSTGVFSYADLSANFNGMRFWNHMLGLNNDILGDKYNFGPYLKCLDNKWVVNASKPIDFKNYIDHSYDESLNCSKFSNQNTLETYNLTLSRLNKDYKCPMAIDKINSVGSKYDVLINEEETISDWMINSKGNGKLLYWNEFKQDQK